MPETYKVTILVDPRNDWLRPFVEPRLPALTSERYRIRIVDDADGITGEDLVFIFGYTRILPADFLARNALNLVVHESDLPRGKGFAPVQWQILEGKTVIPVCLIEAAAEVDAGDILGRTEMALDGTELYDELREKQAGATIAVMEQFLAAYPNVSREKQQGEGTVYPRRRPADGELDPDGTIRDQFNLMRIANNEGWPSFFTIAGQKYVLKIYKSG